MVKIVTDSAASIPQALCQSLGITVLPIPIQFGPTTFTDGVDPIERFYEHLRDSPHAPTTATPSPGAFKEAYEQLLAEGAEAILSIHLMGSKSALCDSARVAARLVDAERIQVVDSGSVSLGHGLLVIEGARLAAAGRSAQEIIAALEAMSERVKLFVAIAEMTQLRKSGRVSLGAALIASALSIKPILEIGQSVIEVVDKVRAWPRALERITALAVEAAGAAPVTLAVLHTNAQAEAEALLERIAGRFQAVERLVVEAGAGLAAHAGPGALGIVVLRHN